MNVKEKIREMTKQMRNTEDERDRLEGELGKLNSRLDKLKVKLLKLEKMDVGTRRKILINGQLFNLRSEFGTIWWLDREGMEKFGFYGGMYLKEWADREHLNKVRGNEIEIKKVEIY